MNVLNLLNGGSTLSFKANINTSQAQNKFKGVNNKLIAD